MLRPRPRSRFEPPPVLPIDGPGDTVTPPLPATRSGHDPVAAAPGGDPRTVGGEPPPVHPDRAAPRAVPPNRGAPAVTQPDAAGTPSAPGWSQPGAVGRPDAPPHRAVEIAVDAPTDPGHRRDRRHRVRADRRDTARRTTATGASRPSPAARARIPRLARGHHCAASKRAARLPAGVTDRRGARRSRSPARRRRTGFDAPARGGNIGGRDGYAAASGAIPDARASADPNAAAHPPSRPDAGQRRAGTLRARAPPPRAPPPRAPAPCAPAPCARPPRGRSRRAPLRLRPDRAHGHDRAYRGHRPPTSTKRPPGRHARRAASREPRRVPAGPGRRAGRDEHHRRDRRRHRDADQHDPGGGGGRRRSAAARSRPAHRIGPARAPPVNQVNLFLYRTSIDAAWRNKDPPGIRPGESGQPPLPLVLSYLVTAYGENDDEILAHRLLGIAMGVLNDRPVLSRSRDRHRAARPGPTSSTRSSAYGSRPDPRPQDEISRMWATFGTGYRLSVSYDAAVVLIDSTRPVSAPAPVLMRGSGDRGPVGHAALMFPQIDARLPPNLQPAARPGDVVTLTGQASRVRHRRQREPSARPASTASMPTSRRPTRAVTVRLPTRPPCPAGASPW